MATSDSHASQPHIVHPAGMDDIELYSGSNPAGESTRMAFDHYLLLLTHGSGASIRYRGTTRQLPETVLMVVNPDEAVTVSTPQGYSYRAAYVGTGLLSGFAAAGGSASAALAEAFGRLYTGEQTAVRAFLRAHRELEDAAGPGDVEHTLTGLWDTLHLHTGADDAPDAPCPVMRRARDYVRQHFIRGVSLDELSSLTGMCRYSLVRAFTREIGVPPHTYQTHLRVHRAKELIAGGLPIARAALEVGFTDQSHLNRHFKSVLGFTPGHYARETRQCGRAA